MHLCNLCGESNLTLLIDFGLHPISKHYLNNTLEKEPVWPVKIFICESCGLTQLKDSCPAEFLYDNYVTLSSWKSQPHVEHEINTLLNYTNLNSEVNIVEIGCNDGMFLSALASSGYKNLLGIEPSVDAYEQAVNKGFEVVNDFLSPELSDKVVKKHGKFDLLISRQNIEHISDLGDVIKSVDILLNLNGYVLIEVPNFDCNLNSKDYSLWEEHVNYFTIDTLKYFLSLSNIEVIHEEIILFSGESIFVIGKKIVCIESNTNYLNNLKIKNLNYANNWPTFCENIIDYLKLEKNSGKKIAVYGAGARTFCLINFVNFTEYIDVIIDDQFEKQNKFMPGGKLPILSSDILYSQKIDICLLAVNTENESKVMNRHKVWIEKGGKFWSILPPSNHLLPIWSSNKLQSDVC